MPEGRRERLTLHRRTRETIRREIDEELRFDLDMRIAELVAAGESEEAARHRALEEFGDLERTREYCAEQDERAERSARWRALLAELRQDVRLSWRGLRREPGFALVVLVTLALGLGANTAVYSVLRRVLIDRLPYAAPARLVRLYGGEGVMLPAAAIEGMRTSGSFEAVGAFGNYGGLTFVGDARAEMWSGVQVDPAFFGVLGVPPLLGRTIDARDVEPGAPPVVVLSHGLWRRAFGGDSSVVGREIRLNDVTRTVIGVMPAAFVSPDRDPEAWTPLDLGAVLRDPVAAYRSRIYRAIGRVAGGATPAGLAAALERVSRQLREAYPATDAVLPPRAVPLQDDMVGSVRPVLLVLMGAAALVLLLCCVNLAELFLARATARRRELAIRAAIGAGRGRLVRQLVTESAVIALAGGALGIALAFACRQVFVGALSSMLPSVRDVPIDAGVLAFALVVSLTCALAFGLLPALAGTRTDPESALRESSRGASAGRSLLRASRLLVVAQVALAVVLLIGAGLLGRTLVALGRTGLGFGTGPELLTFRVNLSSEPYADPARRQAFFDAFLDRVRSLPGVRAAAAVGVSPWSGYTSFGPDSLFVESRAEGAPEFASRVTVSADWFETLGIPLLQGRTFTEGDDAGAAPVALVSESVARRYWPDGNAIGARIRVGRRDAELLTVAGVVADVRPRPAGDVEPTVYMPLGQNALAGGEFVVRTTGSGLALVPAIRRELFALDPTLPAASPRTLAQVFDGMVAAQRLPLLFTGAFALLALVLAVVGVYSIMAYAVTSRRREFAIRIALGAQQASVFGLVLRQGMGLALVGAAAGALAAGAATRWLARLLVGVSPHDPATFSAVVLGLLAVSAAACAVPARRSLAARPVDALRGD